MWSDPVPRIPDRHARLENFCRVFDIEILKLLSTLRTPLMCISATETMHGNKMCVMLFILLVCGQVKSDCGNNCMDMPLWNCKISNWCRHIEFVPAVSVLRACPISLLKTDVKCLNRLPSMGLWGTLPSFSDMFNLLKLFVSGKCSLCSPNLHPTP